MIDSVDQAHGGTMMNRGMDNALYKSVSSVANNIGIGTGYKGVFVNQGWTPQGQWNPPYYSVCAPGDPFPGYLCKFIGWKGERAIAQHPLQYETPVVFNDSNAVLTARYKANMATSVLQSYSNQGKIVKINNYSSVYGMVHESGGEIFHSFSTDGGITWGVRDEMWGGPGGVHILENIEELLSDTSGNSSNPSITHNYDPLIYPHETIVVWEEKINGGTGYRVMMRKTSSFNQYDIRYPTWMSSSIIYENPTSRPFAAKPIISWRTIYWKDTSGIMCKDIDSYTSPYILPGTNGHSHNPVVCGKYGMQYLAWQQDTVGIQYVYQINSGPTWSSPVTIANNTAFITNISPSIASYAPFKVYFAWEECNTSVSQSRINFRTRNWDGTLSPVSLIYSNPLTTAGLSPTLNCNRNDATISVVWSLPTGGIGYAINKNSKWSIPYHLSATGRYASIGYNDDSYTGRQPFAVSKAASAPPYRLQIDTLPISMPQYSLTLNNASFIGSGSGGSYDVNDVNKGANLNSSIIGGVSFKLEAVPPSGWIFYKWSDSVATNPRTVVPTTNIVLNAVYIQQTVSGTISSSTAWSGTINVIGDVIVANGVTLTINPGTIIRIKPTYYYYDEETEEYFTYSTNMVCNGKLLVNGSATSPVLFTSSEGTSGWGTISLNQSGANGSTISYAKIQYGTQIDVLYASNVTIQYSTITDYSGHAINFNGSSGSVLYDTIRSSNIYHGIINQFSYLTCTGNVVKKTGSSRNGVGIFFGGGSHGNVLQNDVRGWNWGICGIWGANASSYLGDNWYNAERNNRVTNCDYGLMVYHSSSVNFGDDDPSPCWKNSVYGNTYNASVGISYPQYGSTLHALDTWWGCAPPDESKFRVGYNSWFNYEAYYPEDPWGVTPLPSVVIAGNGLEQSSISTSILTDGTVGQNSAPASENKKVTSSTKYRAGIELLRQHRYAKAKEFFKAYLSRNRNDVLAHVHLYNCYSDETAQEILQYFESLPNTASPDLKMLLSYLYLKQGNVELAKRINNTIIVQNKNTELAIHSKLNNFYIALYNENNVREAAAILKEALQEPKLSTPNELLLAEASLKSYVDPKTGKMRNNQEQQKDKAKPPSQAVQSTLIGSYPNPFNPTTSINYQLSAISKVSLKVYDMLGREVVDLVNAVKETGYYNATFNASGLASGIYFVRLNVIPQDGSKSVVQTMKMLLLK